MVNLFILVENITTVLAEGYTVIRIYTDTSESGAFASLDGTVSLVANTESYNYTDSDGTSATWYKTAYFGAGPGLGDLSAARKGETAAAYATVIEFRNQVDKTDETDDWEIAQLLTGAKAAIDRICKRPDGFVAAPTGTVRYFPGSGKGHQWIDECAAVSAVSVKNAPGNDEDDYTAWTVGTIGTTTSADCFPARGSPYSPDYTTPYTLLLIGANADYGVFTSGRFRERSLPTVSVTARWGYALTVPHDIREACLMQAARWYKRLQSAMADTLASPDFGTLIYRQTLDPDIEGILVGGGYIRQARSIGRR